MVCLRRTAQGGAVASEMCLHHCLEGPSLLVGPAFAIASAGCLHHCSGGAAWPAGCV